MIDLAILKQSLTDHGDIRPKIALFIEPEAWGNFSQPEDFARFEPFFQEMVLTLFSEMLCLLGKTKEESLFLLLEDIGIQLPSSDRPACYQRVWEDIQRIRANPERVSAEKKLMFALMFPRWLRSVLTKRQRQVAYITAVLLRRSRSAPAVQEINLASQLPRWLFSENNGIHTVLSTLWSQGHVRLVLTEMLDKMQNGEGELSLATEANLNMQLQECFMELKAFCDRHALRENSSLEELSKKSIEDDSLSQYARVLELLVLAGVDLRHIRIQQGKTLLHFAASHGYTVMIEKLLAAGIDINIADGQGQNAFHLAAQRGRAEVVERLLATGVNANLVDVRRQTALHISAEEGHVAVGEKLLAAGIDLNRVDVYGHTALHRALVHQRDAFVEQLLVARADVNLVTAQGETALHLAVKTPLLSSVRVIESLLAAGAKIYLQDNHGRTALHNAASRGNVEIVGLLLAAGLDVNIVDLAGRTAWHYAGNVAVIERLLATGIIDVNLVDVDGQTALHHAADHIFGFGGVERLIAAGVNANLADRYGQTAWHCASSVAVIERLLETGIIDVNLVDSKGQTALHRAARMGRVMLVQRLLLAGVNVNLRGVKGKTALHEAAFEGEVEVVVQLLAADADVNLVDIDGKTPLNLAVDNGHDRVVKLLQAASRQRPSP